jgi:hypothetical protein
MRKAHHRPAADMHRTKTKNITTHGLGTDDEYDQLMSEGVKHNTSEQEGHEVPIEGKHSRRGRPPVGGTRNMKTEEGKIEN